MNSAAAHIEINESIDPVKTALVKAARPALELLMRDLFLPFIPDHLKIATDLEKAIQQATRKANYP